MTDQARLELVRRAYRAFQERDFETIAELSDPDVSFTSLIMESEGTEYRGRDGLREYLNRLVDVLPDWSPQIEQAELHDEAALVRARIRATPPGGSVPVEQTMWQVIRFRDDRALHWDFFRTEEEARDALSG
jgi:ketosteroid isomerase-like protein